MVESDCSDTESNLVVTESHKPKGNGSMKRPREDLSDEEVNEQNKKPCTEELNNDRSICSNITKEVENETAENNVTKTTENTSQDEQNAFSNEKIKTNLNDNSDIEEEKMDRTVENKDEQKMNVSENSIANGNSKENSVDDEEKDITKEETDIKSEEPTNDKLGKNKTQSKSKKLKAKKDDSEIINGVELTVECASDKESSEQSEDEKLEKPRTKTIIIREKPNAFEVDASSTDSEKSNASFCSKTKSPNKENASLQDTKKISVKKEKASKISSASENSAESSSDDEDYNPEKKAKTSSPKKNGDKSAEAKRGRGRPKGRPPKTPKNAGSKLQDEKNKKGKKEPSEEKSDNNIKEETTQYSEELKDKTEIKNEDSTSALSSNENSDNENNENSDNESNEKDSDDKNEKKDKKEKVEKKEKKSSQANKNKIEQLKKYIRVTGIRVKCYQTLLKDCKTDTAKIRVLRSLLEDNGVIGRPTLEKCMKIKKKNETEKEIQELDTGNIISETRVTRRNVQKSQTETGGQKTRKRIQVVDSESE